MVGDSRETRVRTGFALLAAFLLVTGAGAAEPEKPLFREFMGINGHTVKFRPEVYTAACQSVRDYHPIDWDLGDDTSSSPPFPMARNGVDWKTVYGSWKAAGFETDACLMFDNLPANRWKDPARDARAYGKAFASAFGPSAPNPLVAAVEVGNEPGLYDDAAYRTIFENMARGLREGDPKLKIGTCALSLGDGDRYSKSVKCIQGLEGLYDFLNIHTYAEVEGWPSWRRSFPEDPAIPYLKNVEALIAWRDKNVPDKEVRVTEFGWDASSKTAEPNGEFAKWVGSTEAQQAQYLVRSFLVFAKLDVTRADIFFFDDEDEPHVHGSSGLTRKGQPKPAFHAVAHLRKILGDYRFHRVIRQAPGDLYVYEFVHGDDPSRTIWAVWSPTGSGRRGRVSIDVGGSRVLKAERMPLAEGEAANVPVEVRDGMLFVEMDESPVYVRFGPNR